MLSRLDIGTQETFSRFLLLLPPALLPRNVLTQHCRAHRRGSGPPVTCPGSWLIQNESKADIDLYLDVCCWCRWWPRCKCSACGQCLEQMAILFLYQLTPDSSWKAWMQAEWGRVERASFPDTTHRAGHQPPAWPLRKLQPECICRCRSGIFFSFLFWSETCYSLKFYESVMTVTTYTILKSSRCASPHTHSYAVHLGPV